MQLLHILQKLIHKLETGRGVLRLVVIILLVGVVCGLYDLRCFRNMAAPDAMDAAQLARNIARGHGYTTESIRPFSIHLLREKADDPSGKDPARIIGPHPDLANAPVYPVMLAGLMKVAPFRFEIPPKKGPSRYQPDFLITLFNQGVFIVVIIAAFFWAQLLFDAKVAWTSMVLLLGTDLLWRFTSSGLSTMLLMLICMALFWCLTLYEREAREPKLGRASSLILSVAAGLLTGLGGLTRYSFLWMIFPVAAFLALFGRKQQRFVLCVVTVAVFCGVMAPWIVRNYSLSGTPFGTASYSVLESQFPEFHLQRSLQPEIPPFSLGVYKWKLTTNLLHILQTDIFRIGGGWITALFLVGLMIGFRSPALRRLRYFVVASLAVLALAQAFGRTQLSEETPEINSENLLVLLCPLVIVYGVGIFYLLLDTIKVPFYQMRYVAIGLFIALLWLPMLGTLSAAEKTAVAYPPYRPDIIQDCARVVAPDELMMSDVPWAVAWYGDRQCLWLTLNATGKSGSQAGRLENLRDWQESFFAINDAVKPIHALYLTPRSLDSRFQSDWLRAKEFSWGSFIVDTMLKRQAPPDFPLQLTKGYDYWPEQLLLSDRGTR